MFSISYPADEHYQTGFAGGALAVLNYENKRQVIAAKRRLVNVYAFNSSNAAVYLAVMDGKNMVGSVSTTGNSVATFTAPSAHNLQVGDKLSVSGATDTRFNGIFVVTGVVSDTVFTYAIIPGGAATNNNVTCLGVHTLTFYPVQALSFVSIATHGGDRCEVGIYLAAYTDVTTQALAGNVMAYKVDYMAYL